jgi:WD40 repeat protein
MNAQERLGLVAAGPRLFVLDLEQKAEPRPLGKHGTDVTCGAVTRDGHTAVAGDCEGTVSVWDVGSRQVRLAFKLHGAGLCAVAVSPGGKLAVAGCDDGTLHLWGTGDRQRYQLQQPGWDTPVHSVAFSPDGKHILAGGGDKLGLWQLKQGQLLKRFRPERMVVTQVAFSADGSHLLAAETFRGFAVGCWDRETGQLVKTHRLPRDFAGRVELAAIADDGVRAVSLSEISPEQAPVAPRQDTFGESMAKGTAAMAIGGALGVPGVLARVAVDLATAPTSISSGDEARSTYVVHAWRIGEPDYLEQYSFPDPNVISVAVCSSLQCAILGTARGKVHFVGFLP